MLARKDKIKDIVSLRQCHPWQRIQLRAADGEFGIGSPSTVPIAPTDVIFLMTWLTVRVTTTQNFSSKNESRSANFSQMQQKAPELNHKSGKTLPSRPSVASSTSCRNRH